MVFHIWYGFTPHDPLEDTERFSDPVPCGTTLSFTPHDPLEDTESLLGRE